MKIPAVFLLLLLFISCEKSTTAADEVDLGLSYFPMEEGRFWEYAVDSIFIRGNGMQRDTVRSYHRFEIKEVLQEADRSLVSEVLWSTKSSLMGVYTVRGVQSWQRINNRHVIRTEGNLKFIDLIFPVEVNRTWRATSLFDPDVWVNIAGETFQPYLEWRSLILAKKVSQSVGDQQFEDIVQVQLADEDLGLQYRYAMQYFARGVGMIQREMKVFDSQNLNFTLPWDVRVQRGYAVKMQLIDFNK